MTGIFLAAGLFSGGALGFLMGAKPGLLARGYRAIRRRGSHGHDHGDPHHGHGSHDHAGHAQGSHEHDGHGHPAYQAREDQEAQDVIDILYPLAVAFFAGFVFSTLVPDALTHSAGSLAAFAAGLAVMGVLSKWVFKRDPCCEGGHDHRGFGAVSLLAMGVCSLNDGLLLGLLAPAWYSGLNVGMLIHKVTSSFAIAQVLKQTRFRGGALYTFGAFSVLLSPAAFLSTRTAWARSLPDTELILAFSAGLLAWVTLASLVPHARAIIRRRPKAAIGFAIAFAISVSLGFWHTALHRKLESPDRAGSAAP
jgi:zinc transporter ZupT